MGKKAEKRKPRPKKGKLAGEAHQSSHSYASGMATLVKEYSILENNVEVTYTSEAMAIENWISAHMAESFGLDVEWKPTFKKGVRENPVALLQLSTRHHCILIQMQRLDSIPEGLRRLLAAPEVALAGVGIRDDLRKLARDFGLQCRGEVELTLLAVEALGRPDLKQSGLKKLALEVLRKEWTKSKKVSMSNWELDLEDKQISYAAADAWVSFAVHQALRKHRRGRGKREGQGAEDAGQGKSGRDQQHPERAVTRAEETLEAEFTRVAEKRQVDVNPHAAFLKERRKLAGRDRPVEVNGASASALGADLSGAVGVDLRDKLQQGRERGLAVDLRDVLLQKRLAGNMGYNAKGHVRQRLGGLHADVLLDDDMVGDHADGDDRTPLSDVSESRAHDAGESNGIDAGESNEIHEQATAVKVAKVVMTIAQLARKKKKARHRKYGGKKTASAL